MERMRINIDEAITALTERPMKAADAERIAVAHAIKDELTGYPQPERFSRYLSAMLDRVSVPLESHDLIAGRAVIRELTAEEEIFYEELLRDPLYHDSVFEQYFKWLVDGICLCKFSAKPYLHLW